MPLLTLLSGGGPAPAIPTPYLQAVTAELLDTDGTVIVGALDNSYARSFTDIGSDMGRGSCSLGREDPNVSELRRGRYVRILLDGDPAFTFKIQGSIGYTEITVGEELRLSRTVKGLGWGCVFNEAVLHPEPGIESPLDYTHRLWSFASRNFQNTDGWEPAVELYEFKEGVDYGVRVEGIVDPGADPDDTADDVLRLYASPKDFPWPNADKNGNGFEPTPDYDPVYWVIAGNAPNEAAIGYHFFLGDFTLAGLQEFVAHATADNFFILFIDGAPIIQETGDTLMWLGWKQQGLTLGADTHRVGFVCENIPADIPYNPGGALFDVIAVAVYPGDVQTSLTLSLLTSGATDLPLSWFSEDDWPGWYAGQIIPDATDEAQTQGVLPLYVGGSFSATEDTDGNDFPVIPLFAMDIGRTLGEMLRALNNEGHIDWHFRPDTLTLDVWVKGMAGELKTPVFHRPTDPDDPFSGNIQELQRGEVAPYANYLLVQWSGGVTVVENLTEQAAYGSVVQGFYRTDAASLSEAKALGNNELDRRILGASAAISMQILPMKAKEAPYVGYGMFDYITIPNEEETGTDAVQVLTIDMSEDAEGWAIWKLEVNEHQRSPQRDLLDLLQAFGGVTFTGGGTGRVDR